ncbi:hypothetical protein ACSBR1_008216 [Camellia fascicularis]
MKKSLSDFGIATQCISPTKINDQYLTNVLLKINSKGHILEKGGFLQIFCGVGLRKGIKSLKQCGKGCKLKWLNYLRPDIKRDKKCNRISCSSYCHVFRCLNTYIGHPCPCDRSKWICYSYSCSYNCYRNCCWWF